jgi:hypothetical protein
VAKLKYLGMMISYQNGIMKKLRAGFEVLTAVSMKMAVFWVVAPCSQVKFYLLATMQFGIFVFPSVM